MDKTAWITEFLPLMLRWEPTPVADPGANSFGVLRGHEGLVLSAAFGPGRGAGRHPVSGQNDASVGADTTAIEILRGHEGTQ